MLKKFTVAEKTLVAVYDGSHYNSGERLTQEECRKLYTVVRKLNEKESKDIQDNMDWALGR